MAKRELLTDAQVEKEIERLTSSEYVKLARREQRLKYKRRQLLYNLRNLEARGKELANEGYTVDNIDEMIAQMDTQEERMKKEREKRQNLIAELERLHREQRGWQRLVEGETLDYEAIAKIPTDELEKIVWGLR